MTITTGARAQADPTLTEVLAAPGQVRLRPRYEGSNICTWIGFKHVNYLVEEAVLAHLRERGLAPGLLYERYGLGVDIVDLDTRILHAFHIDDTATAEVVPLDPADGELVFAVSVHIDGPPTVKAVTSKVRVVLRHDPGSDSVSPPAGLLPVTSTRISRTAGAVRVGRLTTRPDAVANDFHWRWRVPYFYCHFTKRLQMSGYLRLMEEGVDLFLADRGISIKTLLDDRDWIPVVPYSRISMLDEVRMEEEIRLVMTVEQVFKEFTYESRFDWYVTRDGRDHHVAVGRIVHGYAVIENRRDWRLVNFDERMMLALTRPTTGAGKPRGRGDTADGGPDR